MSQIISITKPGAATVVKSWDSASPTEKDITVYNNGADIIFNASRNSFLIQPIGDSNHPTIAVSFDSLDDNYSTADAEAFVDYLSENDFFLKASGGNGALDSGNLVQKRTAKPISASTYTILPTDTSKYLEFSSACVVTVPLGFLADLEFEGEQVGIGEVSFVSAATGTINQFVDFDNKTAGQFSPFGLRTKGGDISTLIGTLKLA